tara:strand:- start:352 stop:768 length:417 start_codon:yes stop_codon:yes gene_type:complete
MIKIQKKDFNIENEITILKNQYSNVGAINIFVGYVRDLNKNKNVKYINLEVYKDMAIKELSKIKNQALNKWKLVDCLILHRYGKLFVNDKIVLVVCLSEHREDSFDSCKFIMNFLKKDAPFWKKEFYDSGSDWLQNTN